jgi:small basic protein
VINNTTVWKELKLSRAAVMVFPIRCRLFCNKAAMNRQMIKRNSVLNKRDDFQ